MTVTAKNVIPSKLLETSQTTQYSAQNVKALIDKCTITNVGTGAAKFSINLITTGSAGANNTIIKDQSVAVGACYTCAEIVGHVLESGGSISTICDIANTLVIRVSGREVA